MGKMISPWVRAVVVVTTTWCNHRHQHSDDERRQRPTRSGVALNLTRRLTSLVSYLHTQSST